MTKEALIEAIPNKKIILSLGSEFESATALQFKDGNMYLQTNPGYFYMYLNYYSDFNIDKVL